MVGLGLGLQLLWFRLCENKFECIFCLIHLLDVKYALTFDSLPQLEPAFLMGIAKSNICYGQPRWMMTQWYSIKLKREGKEYDKTILILEVYLETTLNWPHKKD